MHSPSHPGEILREYMGEQITVSDLARHLKISRPSLSMILNGRGGVSPEMSLKLDDAFGTSEGFWFRLQNIYDLTRARKTKKKKISLVASITRLAARRTA